MKDLVSRYDVVLIVGSVNSSNSVRMVEVAREHGAEGHLVPDVDHLDENWVGSAKTIGISSRDSAGRMPAATDALRRRRIFVGA